MCWGDVPCVMASQDTEVVVSMIETLPVFLLLLLYYFLIGPTPSLLSTEACLGTGFDLIQALRFVWTGGARGRKYASDASTNLHQKL